MTLNVLLLADESADWNIAGLRQINRIALALNEMCQRDLGDRTARLSICWRPGTVAPTAIKTPRSLDRLAHDRVDPSKITDRSFDLVLSTRVLIARSCPWANLERRSCAGPGSPDWKWDDLLRECNKNWQAARLETDGCEYLDDSADLDRCERRFLRGGGKSHDDGFVSRYLNRPISRSVSRLLIKTSMVPNVWTLLILLLPMAGFGFLLRADYLGFLVGALCFHLHSVLDGCDGEIARAKYLDSEKGPGFDALGDLISLLLFALGMGAGLFRQAVDLPNLRWIYLSEGILAAFLLAYRLGRHAFDLLARGRAAVISSEHNQRLRDSGGRLVGSRFTSFLFQCIKRDVVFFAFVVLAILGLATWSLHFVFLFALISLLLLLKGRPQESAPIEPTPISQRESA